MDTTLFQAKINMELFERWKEVKQITGVTNKGFIEWNMRRAISTFEEEVKQGAWFSIGDQYFIDGEVNHV